MKPKKINQEEVMPIDFWNYKVNPILGYYLEPQVLNTVRDTNKYAIKSIPNKL